ncbi:MAG: PLP-dependent transferase [Thermaerobacterales bacterium]
MRRRDTIAARALEHINPSSSVPAVAPLQLASVYLFEDLAHVDRVWDGHEAGYVYARRGNPNVHALENVVAGLEGGAAGAAAASGMSILLACILAVAQQGQRIVAARDVYGGTHQLLTDELPRLGIETSFVDLEDTNALESAAAEDHTVLLLVETISNPLVRVADMPGLAALAARHGLKLLVDNTFASPVLFNPLMHGADLTVHSATKYLGGHADLMGGVAAGESSLIKRVQDLVNNLGPNLEPFSAWLTLRGIQTLSLRVERQSANALALAGWLQPQDPVERVYYTGLADDGQHARASELLPRGSGGMLAFELKGGLKAADAFIRGLSMVKFAPSLGDVMTSVSHPAKTSHRYLSQADRNALDIHDGVIRVSTGVEDINDLTADFAAALAKAATI